MKFSKKSVINFAVCLFGLGGIAVTRSVFISASGGKGPGTDDYFLFFRLSVILCLVLLVLTSASAIISLFAGENRGKEAVITRAAPVVSSVIIVIIGIIYAFMTRGGLLDIFPYVILTSVFEAMVFRLPCALTAIGKE